MGKILEDIDRKLRVEIDENRDKDDVFLWFLLSYCIILESFGKIWFKQNCDIKLVHKNKFLSDYGGTVNEHFNCQSRVIFFGHLIYSLKDCEGFEYFLNSLKTKDIESCNWEMSVAETYIEKGYKVKFVKETGIKGQDYDLLIFKDSLELHVEAKNRTNSPILESSLKNVLSKSRKQLPIDGYGIIHIAIPKSWTTQANSSLYIGKQIDSFFQNTSRVKFVVLEWEEWIEIKPEERIQMKLIKVYKNTFNSINHNLKLDELRNPSEFIPSYFSKNYNFKVH